jgi:hypothetical protein
MAPLAILVSNKDENYTLKIHKNLQNCKIALTANDSSHAQAQAEDICRSLDATSFNLSYGQCKSTPLSDLYKDLSSNNFSHKKCSPWLGKFSNNVPCIYIFKQRYYVRSLILKYLDIPREEVFARPSCNCKSCINPYHFAYEIGKNTKLGSGDWNLVLAFLGQGTGVDQIAGAFKIHRSTIYRKLKNERILAGAQNHS